MNLRRLVDEAKVNTGRELTLSPVRHRDEDRVLVGDRSRLGAFPRSDIGARLRARG